MSDFGKKGGTGPTAGKHAHIYGFTYPDGRVGAKKVFKFDGMPACAYVYEHGGTWYVAGISHPNDSALGHYTSVPAQRGDDT